jgi:hypothetical protein
MAICTTAQVLQYLGSNAQQGTTLYNQIDRLRSGVEGRIKKFLKWGLEANSGVPQGQYFGYYDGKNYADIQLRNLFVTVYGVWLDPFGYGGQNTNNYTPFGSGTQLVAGQDYMVINDSDGPAIGVSKSAMIRRLRQNQDLCRQLMLFHEFLQHTATDDHRLAARRIQHLRGRPRHRHA